MESLEDKLAKAVSGLFREPRETNADAIVCRVRNAMEEAAAMQVAPWEPVVVVDCEEAAKNGVAAVEGSVLVSWKLVETQTTWFVVALSRWVESGAHEHAETARAAALSLLHGWVEAVRTALLGEALQERWGLSELGYCRCAVHRLVLMGWMIDTGHRGWGETLWALGPSALPKSKWDA